MTVFDRARHLMIGNESTRKKGTFIVTSSFFGILLGLIVILTPGEYLILALAGLIFLYLVFFKIEVAIIIALFAQTQLSRFNYMGGGTPFHPNGIMGISLIMGAAFYLLTHKIDPARFRYFGGALGFLVMGILSLINAGTYLMDGVTVTLRLVTALSIYAVLVQKINSINQVKWVIGAVIAAQIYPTIVGLSMVAGRTGALFTDETMRLGNSGVGVYLAIISILCLVFLFGSRTNASRILWGVLSSLFLAGLFFSYGRSGWIGFCFGMAMISMIRFKRLVIVIPLALILLIVLIPAFGQRFADISFGSDSSTLSESTFSARLEYWQAALTLFPNHPVMGVGLGVGRYRVGDFRGLYPNMIHNDYVSVLLEVGLVGFILFMVWNYQWVNAMFRIYRTEKDDLKKLITLAVMTAFVSSLVMRITDNIILDSYDMYPLCALVAAVFSLSYISKPTMVQGPDSSSGNTGQVR